MARSESPSNFFIDRHSEVPMGPPFAVLRAQLYEWLDMYGTVGLEGSEISNSEHNTFGCFLLHRSTETEAKRTCIHTMVSHIGRSIF